MTSSALAKDYLNKVEKRLKTLPKEVRENVEKIAQVSKELRKERELAFYGDIDFIPSEEYKKEDAEKVIKETHFVGRMAKKVVK